MSANTAANELLSMSMSAYRGDNVAAMLSPLLADIDFSNLADQFKAKPHKHSTVHIFVCCTRICITCYLLKNQFWRAELGRSSLPLSLGTGTQ